MRRAQQNRPPCSDETRQKISTAVALSYTPELRALRSVQFSELPFDEKHRTNLSAGANRRWSSSEGLQERKKLSKLASERVGCKSTRSQRWTLMSPTGDIVVTCSCLDFCASLGLNYSALRNKARAKDTSPCAKGSAKGWSVLGRECKDPTR